jgi:hypothetical protein
MKGPVDRIDSSCLDHTILHSEREIRWLRSGKKPGEEVDCGNGHTDAEQNASHDSF